MNIFTVLILISILFSEMFNINGLIDFGKQNVGTLMSLLESLWSILIGNLSLIIGSFSTFLSLILGGGTAVLNFILNVVSKTLLLIIVFPLFVNCI